MTKEKAIEIIHEACREYFPFDGDKKADEVIKALTEDAIDRQTVLDLLDDDTPVFKLLRVIVKNLPPV